MSPYLRSADTSRKHCKYKRTRVEATRRERGVCEKKLSQRCSENPPTAHSLNFGKILKSESLAVVKPDFY